MGHTWLRVTIDGETRDLWAGHMNNRPDQVNFAPLAPVWPGNRFTLLLTHLRMLFLPLIQGIGGNGSLANDILVSPAALSNASGIGA
jgi:hypothetical protein